MVNRYHPHVFVLPEDHANNQLTNGFLLDVSLSIRQTHVLPVAGGWTQVFERLHSDHVVDMDRWPERLMVLLIDCDGDEDRLETAKARIPEHLRERVFLLGALRNPEELRTAGLGSYESIGLAMAKDCREGTTTIWGHELLRHNASELARLRNRVWPILF
jgi:hypothetical protein